MALLIGGYTNKTGRGIYTLPFVKNDKQTKVGPASLLIKVGGPTYFRTTSNLIFTINHAGQKGGISVFKKGQNGYHLTASYLTAGPAPCYIGIDRKKQLVFTANYHTAVLSVFSYTKEGKLNRLAYLTHQAQTLGTRPEQQDGPHPHFFDETPAGNLVSCDLGNDMVDFYQLKNHQLVHLASYHNEAGFGTRHIVFAQGQPYFYVVGELSSKVNLVHFDEQTWQFKNIATYKTIPESYTAHNGAAAIRLSEDGHYLYISNRGYDAITVFAVQPDHTLKLAQHISTFGSFPRDFNWDQGQKNVVVANQNTDNATLYSRNEKTGMLTPVQKNIQVPEGTCVVFNK